MDFEGEIDPEIAARHKAVFDDLANEIDALDSDGEGDSYQPQPKAQQKPAPKSGASNKMYKVEADDDMGFPKFDNAAFKELEQGLKMKNNFDDLENEIMNMDSDDDGPSTQNKPHKTLTKEPTNFTKPATNPVSKQSQEGSNPSVNTRPQANSVNQQSNASKGTSKSSTVSFPFNHFTGLDPKKLIEIDNKLHGKDCLMTLGLVNYELEEIIDPCLSSANVDEEIKKHLETKKKSLVVFKNNISNLFKKGDLNATKYIQLIAKMKTTNIKVAQDLQKANASKETDRVKERLRILVEEEKEYLGMAQGAPAKTSAPTSNKSSETRKKEPNLVDSLKPVAETKINKVLPSEIDGLSNEELRDLLKKRKDQYWNLATYMSKEVLKHFEGNELAQKKQFIQNSLIPLIQKGSKYLENFDTEDSGEIADFLKDTLVEVTPALLHGKSLKERSADLQKIIELIETCTKEETDYTEKQRAALDDAAGPGGKKVKEGEKAIEKNGEYIEYLSKLSSDKFMWVPTPKVTIGKEQRTISLVNKDVDAKSMLVKFKGLEHLTHRKYWMRWTIEGAQGQMHFTTHHCDEHSLQFNYQQLVQMTTKEKLDSSIENKQIHIEVLYKQMFVEKKKAEGVIPLTGLRKSNHIEGKVQLRSDGIELSYVLRVREPLLKHIKIDVSTVHSFQTFEAFDRNAPVVQAPPPEKKPAKPQEERKTQEPAAAAAAGGGGKLFEKKKYPPLVLLPQANDPLASLNEKELPPGITLELAKDPSNPDLIDCLSVLKLLAEELEKARTGLAVEGRRNDNKVVSDNWTKALRKATILEAKFGSGDIDPSQYIEMLKAGLDRDQKLIQLYKAKGDNDRLAFTLEKMNHTKKEQKELEDALAAEGEEGS